MTLIMYDSVDVTLLPADAPAYAGYVNGSWPTYDKLKARFPKAKLLSVAVQADANAECLDVETGDATVGQAPDWHARQVHRGLKRPAIYTEASNLKLLERVMSASGIARGQYRIWSAHYTEAHFCGPRTCGYGDSDADGTQWTKTALAKNLDQSILNDDFFGVATDPPVEVKPGFWRHVADGTESLTTFARRRKTRARILAHHTLAPASPINAENRAKFVKYRKSTKSTGGIMPKGLVFYSFHK